MSQLVRLPEFEVALAGYEPSDETLSILKRVRLALLVGPTGSGRNTIISQLLQKGGYWHVVSDTTREMRRSKTGDLIESPGNPYWFCDEAYVLGELRKGHYIEAGLIHGQQVSGLHQKWLIKALQAGSVAIKDMEPNGAANVYARKPDTDMIYVVPALTFKEWMDRFRSRSQMDDQEVKRRLLSARDELVVLEGTHPYRLVVNDHLPQAVDEVHRAITGEIQVSPEQQAWAGSVALQLRQSLDSYLVGK